ncbi:MAG: phosphoribosylglycinamide formyltransferase [Bdellovibrionales bacterium GWA2_49_15]|nr:MAG: phosphoribosylglycinamide formyltransferase [Bdellovibrionales bacterium GWA2_49_15]HAZ13502.1 phosphoribosylglycinamide formyltransferase [Bdellovibrionales bacterium]
MQTRKLAIMASGDGTNAEAIMRWCHKFPHLAQVVAVLSDHEDAYVLSRAKNFGVPGLCMPYPKLKADRAAHEEKMSRALLEFGAEWVCLAGFMRILGASFLQSWKLGELYRVANIHPSLLPAFKGANAYQDAFDAGVKISGVTIHLVTEALDNGPIVLQKSFPRLEKDDFATFKSRGRSLEGPLWHEFLEAWSRGHLVGRSTPTGLLQIWNQPAGTGGSDAILSL